MGELFSTAMPPNADQVAALDNPIWSALTMDHQGSSGGGRLARRYDPAISVFAAMKEPGPEAYDDLRALLKDGDQVALFTTQPLSLPASLRSPGGGECFQMICRQLPERLPTAGFDIIDLTAEDVPDMQALVALTQPGPFTARTIELGRYIGIRQEGLLIAMVGERMRFDGFVEVSAVCVHTDHRGKRLAQILTAELCARIAADGNLPFLHVFVGNAGAIALYEKLGFVKRQRLQVTRLALAPVEA